MCTRKYTLKLRPFGKLPNPVLRSIRELLNLMCRWDVARIQGFGGLPLAATSVL